MLRGKKIREVGPSGWLRAGRFVFLGALLVTILVVGMGRGVARPARTAPPLSTAQPADIAPSGGTLRTSQPSATGQGLLYLVDTPLPLDLLSRILALDPQTGAVQVEVWARYKPAVALSPDERTLCVVDSFLTRVLQGEMVHALTAIDTQSWVAAWEIDLPGERQPYMGEVTTGVWLSADGRRVYTLMASAADDPTPRLVEVDTETHQVVKEISIPLPHDPRSNWPRFWKLPWAETLVAVSGDQLFSVDLATGQQEEAISLPGFDDRSRIPGRRSQVVEVGGGAIAPQARRLYLVTSAGDVIAVEPDSQPAQRVFTLPPEWEFGLFTPVVASADGQRAYLAVRRVAAPIAGARVAEEIWAYDTAAWQPLGTVRPGGEARDHPGGQGVVSMALSRDERRLYAVNAQAPSLSIIDTESMAEATTVGTLQPRSASGSTPSWIVSP